MGAQGALLSLTASQAALSGAETYSTYQAQRSQAKWQRLVSEENRKMADLMAEDALRRGERSAQEYAKGVRKLKGSQRAALAAQGIDIESGSALDIQEETAAFGQEDIQTIRNNAWREAWGFKVEAQRESLRGRLGDLASRSEQRRTLLAGGLRLAGYGVEAQRIKMGKS